MIGQQPLQWSEKRVLTGLAHLESFISRPNLHCLDLAHRPQTGALLEKMGMRVTGGAGPQSALAFRSDSFDVVTAFDVIDCVSGSPHRVLREIRRVLRPGGLLYVVTASGSTSYLADIVRSEGFIVQDCVSWDVSERLGVYDTIHRALASAGRLATGKFRDATRIWRSRDRLTGLLARKRNDLFL